MAARLRRNWSMFLSAFAVASRLRAVCSSPLLRKRGTETTVQPVGDELQSGLLQVRRGLLFKIRVFGYETGHL